MGRKSLIICLFLWALPYFVYAAGSRDETRVCLDEWKTGNNRYGNCVWIGDLETVMEYGENNTIEFKNDVIGNQEWCKKIGFYTCTGAPDRHSKITFNNTKVYKTNYCTKQGQNVDGKWSSNCIYTRASGSDDEEIEDEEEVTELIIEEDSVTGREAIDTIYTKVSGSSMEVRIYHQDSSGAIGSGLNSASCEVANASGSMLTSGSASFSLWSGAGAYVFKVGSGVLNKSGYHTLQCTGTDKKGNVVRSSKLPFYVAPASYTAGFTINGNGVSYTMDSKTATSNGSTTQLTLSDTSSFPVSKISQGLRITLSGSANTKSGSVDSGVSTAMTQSTASNTIEGLNATSGTKVCQADAPTLPSGLSVSINNGSFNGSATLAFSDVYKGTFSITYTDSDMASIIESERARGGCSNNGTSNGQCPVPPTFTFSFDYLIVPDGFDVIVNTASGDEVKVLYYGQGNSPLNETTSNLQVIPTNASDNYIKNFVSGCAAIDTDLELTGSDISVVFINPSDTTTTTTTSQSTTILASEFTYDTDKSIANLDRVLSVQQIDGNAWTPDKVAEPLNFGASVVPLMYFTGKKSDSAYPQYTPDFDSLDRTIILRGRINIIDADNANDYSAMPTSKVYYEFYCQTCDLNDVMDITGVTKYVGSPTSQGWWIDTTFSTYNTNTITKDNITTTNGLNVDSVSDFADGLQNISYGNASNGKYEVMVNHSNDSDSFPAFLLYKPFYSGSSDISGTTNAFVTIYNQISDDNTRDFGLDSGAAKNTRSGSRTGGF